MINTLILFPHTVSFQDIPVKHFEVSQAHEAIRSLFVEKKKKRKKKVLCTLVSWWFILQIYKGFQQHQWPVVGFLFEI